MVPQTTGGLFQYSHRDAQADEKTRQAAMAAKRSGSFDYMTFQGGAGPGGSLTINLHNWNVYAGGSISASREAGAGVVFGIILDNVGLTDPQKATATDNLLAGPAVGANGCLYGVCGGLNHSIGGQTAVEVGVGVGGVTRAPNPGGNGSWSYSAPFFTIPGIGNGKN